MKNFPMEKLRRATKNFPQAKNLLKWERKQAYGNYKKGIAHGIILGAIMVAVLFVIFFGILR